MPRQGLMCELRRSRIKTVRRRGEASVCHPLNLLGRSYVRADALPEGTRWMGLPSYRVGLCRSWQRAMNASQNATANGLTGLLNDGVKTWSVTVMWAMACSNSGNSGTSTWVQEAYCGLAGTLPRAGFATFSLTRHREISERSASEGKTNSEGEDRGVCLAQMSSMCPVNHRILCANGELQGR